MRNYEDDPRRRAKSAHSLVQAANAAVAHALPPGMQDHEDARRGFVATIPDAAIVTPHGRTVWTLEPYGFLEDTPPDTVNPSLWRRARLGMNHGLFKVTERVYQIRGFDIANMTLIEGDTGLIVVDTLTSAESARAALELYFAQRGRRPVVAVIYTHTHADHWGGIDGVLWSGETARGDIPIIAPDFFIAHAASENVVAGNAMLRRAQYQFGSFLPRGARGQVDCGLGKAMAAGSVSLVAPNDLITYTGESRTIDGVDFVFQMAPQSEAPAEFHFYLPQFKTLNMADNAPHAMHNLLPFRGSEVRDARAWSFYLSEALHLFGDEADILIGQHDWPVWGNARLRTHLAQQRDAYKFVHDQTIRLLNHGLTPSEIAEALKLPQSLDAAWHTRGYYGDLRHNVKAVYQRVLGWYDCNPAHLDPLPPVALGRGLVGYMGGSAAILSKARSDFEEGAFRLVAEVLNHLVFAEPDNEEARLLLADTYEQLGYACESALWRNAYLVGAQELRHGVPKAPSRSPISEGTLRALDVEQLFDYLGVRLIADAAAGHRFLIGWHLTDSDMHVALRLENCALTYLVGHQPKAADAAFTLSRDVLCDLITGGVRIDDAVRSGRVICNGDAALFQRLMDMMDSFERMFEIVEPRRARSGRSPAAR